MSLRPLRDAPDEALSHWYAARPTLIQFLLKSAAITLLGFAVFAILLDRFATNFVLSNDYINRVWLWPAFCGAGICVPFAILFLKDRSVDAAPLKLRMFAAVALVSFGAAFAHLAAAKSGPALVALWVHDDITVNTTIERFIYNSNKRGCRFAIVTADLDLPAICNPPSNTQGDKTFSIHGYGTVWAFFWTSIEPSSD